MVEKSKIKTCLPLGKFKSKNISRWFLTGGFVFLNPTANQYQLHWRRTLVPQIFTEHYRPFYVLT
jgi:hypothetical protein